MKTIWVIDGHCDSLGDFSLGKRDLRSSTDRHWDLERARQGRVGLQFLAAYIESEYKPYQATWRGLQLIQAAQRFVAENSERVFLIRNRVDLTLLPALESTGILLSVEGGEILGESLFMLDIIYQLGVRALGLTWNQRNALADGTGEQDTNSRLTRLGQSVVKRMNELGMVIDVSHLNEPGFWHVLEISEQPVLASHSCAAALCPHPRNLTDDQLRELSRRGGLVGVNFFPTFLSSSGRADRKDVIAHIRHIAGVAGVETVGLGSDFDGISETPEGLEHAGKFPELIDDLAKEGFSKKEIEKICFGNFVRLLSNVIK
ncbi:MAG: dipeptidase [Desulfitobacteriaceae bacterium]